MNPGSHPQDLVLRMVDVVRGINPQQPMPEIIHHLLGGAVEIFPEIDHASLSVTHRDGHIESTAASGAQFDQLEANLHEGPSHDAMSRDSYILIQNARQETRWPRYIPAATDLGLRAQLTLPLPRDSRTARGLNLYSTRSETIGEATTSLAQLYASHVAAILSHDQEKDDLTKAMRSRQLIGQATGILMERLHLGPDEAFAYLVRVSSTSNVKIRDLSSRIVAGEEPTER